MTMARLSAKIRDIFGDGAFDWADRSYAVDWWEISARVRQGLKSQHRAIATGWLLLSAYISKLPVFEREFSLEDPLIGHPHTNQQ